MVENWVRVALIWDWARASWPMPADLQDSSGQNTLFDYFS
jgi:hypothetical protein